MQSVSGALGFKKLCYSWKDILKVECNDSHKYPLKLCGFMGAVISWQNTVRHIAGPNFLLNNIANRMFHWLYFQRQNNVFWVITIGGLLTNYNTLCFSAYKTFRKNKENSLQQSFTNLKIGLMCPFIMTFQY